jgi:membrane protease subunit HflC
MKRHMGIVILVLLALVTLLTMTVTYVVDETKDIVLITTFGKVTKVVDGRAPGGPGLHWKWPLLIQNVVRLDSREHPLSTSTRQLQIGQKINITATMFCLWRIEDPEKLYRAMKDQRDIDSRLRGLLESEMANVLGKVDMDRLVNTDPEKMDLHEIDADILRRVNARTMEDYGIGVSRVGGLKLLGLPQSVSKVVIENMNAEREEEITKYQADGQAAADAIKGRATAARDKILAFANRKAGEIRAQGEAKAAEAYQQFREDPDFAMFLRSLETLRAGLKQRTVLVLDADMMPILRWLWNKPSMETFKKK